MRACLLLVLLLAPILGASPRLGVVNVSEVYLRYTQFLGIEESYNQQAKALEQNPRFQAVKETDARLKELSETLKNSETSEESREVVGKEFTLLSEEFTSLSTELREFLAGERLRLTAEKVVLIEKALENIQLVVRQLGKEQKLDYVFDVSGESSSQSSPIVYVREPVDLTASVIERLGLKNAEQTDP